MKHRFAKWVNTLGETSSPLFGQLSLWIVLGVTGSISNGIDLHYSRWSKGEIVSVLGLFLPTSVLSNPDVLHLCRSLFWIAATGWAMTPFLSGLKRRTLKILLLLASWTTCASYMVMASMYWENLPWFRHKYVLPGWILLIYALWTLFYRVEIVTAIRTRSFWSRKLFPRWVHSSSVGLIGLFYTFSGLSKLLADPGWGSGISLQLWMTLFADHESRLTQFILARPWHARLFQSGALMLELAAFLALFLPRFRPLVGLGLLAFHHSVDATFHIPFTSNKALLILFFLPLFQLMPVVQRWCQTRRDLYGRRTHPRTPVFPHAWFPGPKEVEDLHDDGMRDSAGDPVISPLTGAPDTPPDRTAP